MRSIQEALQGAVDRLENRKVQTPLLDAEVLLCHVLDKDRLYLYLHRQDQLEEKDLKKFEECVQKRLQGTPVQYITGHQEFMGLDFYVEEGVLIPRPDTEVLVETVLDWAKNNLIDQKKILMADLGTGSGATTVSLAKYLSNGFVFSVDISPKALAMGKKNALGNGVLDRIQFLKGDLLQPLDDQELQDRLDILVSNPPYIPREVIKGLQIEVSGYEPRLALDGGEDGLDFYRRIVHEGHQYLRQGGFLALEVGHDQADEVQQLMEEKGLYTDIQKIKDLSGIERVVTATVDKREIL